MTRARVLLAGTGTPGVQQHHQRDMYLPAVRAMEDVELLGVLGGDDAARAQELAGAAGAPLWAPGDEGGPAVGAADLVVVCPDLDRTDRLEDLLRRCADAGTRVLVDKPTLLPTEVLDDLASRFPDVLAAHHARFHPALQTARARVTTGALGLVHAVHGELLVGPADGPHPRGELRNLAVYCLDVVQSLVGDLRGRGHLLSSAAGPDGAGEAHTLTLRLEPDVVVTLLVGREGPSDDRSGAALHRYRVLGSHGQLLVDLDSPALDVVGRGRRPFGPGSVERLLEAALGGAPEPRLAHAAALARLVDALEEAAASRRPARFPPAEPTTGRASPDRSPDRPDRPD